MKKRIGLFMMALLASSPAFAEVEYRYLNTETSVSEVDLLQEASPGISAVVSYPGKLSGICGIKLRVHAEKVTILDILKLLDVKAPFPQNWKPQDRIQIPDDRTMLVKLYPEHEAYMAVLNVSTRDGTPIVQSLKEAFPQGGLSELIISGTPCN